jgi:phage terminase large subunit
MTEVSIEIVPRRQFRSYLGRKERWACIVAHRRAGKTVACIMDLIKRAVEHRGVDPRFAYVCPTYTQAKDVAWAYLKRYTASIPEMEVSESELWVKFPHNKARIRLYGADNYDRLRGIYLDGAVIDEAGDTDPRAVDEVIRPALSDRKGWATFIGTPKGRNQFHRIHLNAETDETWFSAKLKASQTGLIDPEELDEARRQMTPEAFAQEYECSFDASVKGAYYGKDVEQAETESRIARVAYDKAADVFASWDLGIGDMTAIWFGQIVGKEWHWIGYYENSGQGLDHYVDYVKSLRFPVHRHYLPHDAEARELQSGKSRIEFLEARNFNCTIVPRHNVEDGINAARTKFNRMWFDRDNCQRGLDCLRMYRTEFDDKKMVFKSQPLHDWASHGADAFRCGVMGVDENQNMNIDFKIDRSWVA